MQKLLANPPVLRDFLDSEIAALDRLVVLSMARAMKKKPKSIAQEIAAQMAHAGI